MSCEGCNRANSEPEKIPYIVYEGAMARSERAMKRLVIALIIAVVLMFASNAAWLWAWTQYDYASSTEIEAEQDGDGINIVGGGNINYGAESQNNENTNPN